MKRIFAFILSACLLLALTSCKKDDTSSSSVPSSSSEPVASGSQSASQDQIDADKLPTSSGSPSSTIDSSQWPKSFVNIVASDGVELLIEPIVPQEWSFDSYSTYSLHNKKMMEIMYVEKITDLSNPFNIPYVEQFTEDLVANADDFGFIKSQEVILPTTKAMLYLRKDLPFDSETPIYPHIYLVQKGDYIVVVSFTTEEEDCAHLHLTYDEILDKIELFV